MKLYYITNASMPSPKAHGLQIMKSCEAFAAAGADVTLVLPTKVRVIKEDPFDYYGAERNFRVKKIFALDLIWLLPERLGFYLNALTFGASALIYALIHVRKGDIIYSRDIPTLLALCFVGFHPAAEIHDYRSRKPRKLIQFILNRCQAVVFNSEGTKSFVIRHYSFVIPALVAPNAVDPDFFNIPETREQAREELGLPQDRIIIGYVGRFSVAGMDKGVGMLRGAFERMKRRVEAYLLIVGGPELSVPYARVPLYLRAIDIAVIPYPGDQHAKTTSPIKRYEYMAAGKAIVTADSPDPQRLADALDALVADPARTATLGAQSREEAHRHTWSQRAQKILDFLKKNSTITWHV